MDSQTMSNVSKFLDFSWIRFAVRGHFIFYKELTREQVLFSSVSEVMKRFRINESHGKFEQNQQFDVDVE
jgi:hypothetical protein